MTCTANGSLDGKQISVTEAKSLCDDVDRAPLIVGEKWSVQFSLGACQQFRTRYLLSSDWWSRFVQAQNVASDEMRDTFALPPITNEKIAEQGGILKRSIGYITHLQSTASTA